MTTTSGNKVRAWVLTLHRFEHHEVSGAVLGRREEVARLDGNLPPTEVARFMEHWYAERYQSGWVEGVEVETKGVSVGDEIDVGYEPKLTARLVEELDG